VAGRRKQDAGGAILGIIVLASIAVVFTIVTSLVYGGAVIFSVGVILSLIGYPEEPPPTVYLSRVPDLRVKEQHVNAAFLKTTGEIVHVYTQGESSGLRRTAQSSNQLFDRRFPEAEVLNHQLQILYSRAQNQSSTLHELHAEREDLEAIWRYVHGSWQNRTALLRGLRLSATAYVPTTLAVAIIPGGLDSQISAKIANLVWFDTTHLRPYYMALVCGTVVSTVTALLAGFSLRSDLAAQGRLAASTWLREQEAKPSTTENQPEEPQASQRSRTRANNPGRERARSSERGHKQHSGAATEAKARRWFEVLEVGKNATAAEITAAWRAKVQKNHPDMTARLDPEFQKLAERRTKEINGAKAEGLRQHS